MEAVSGYSRPCGNRTGSNPGAHQCIRRQRRCPLHGRASNPPTRWRGDLDCPSYQRRIDSSRNLAVLLPDGEITPTSASVRTTMPADTPREVAGTPRIMGSCGLYIATLIGLYWWSLAKQASTSQAAASNECSSNPARLGATYGSSEPGYSRIVDGALLSNWVKESLFPSGSLNHATSEPPGKLQIPISS